MSDDSEEKDILAVKIKHHGQCPFEKGHSDNDFHNGYMIGLCTIPIAAALALFLEEAKARVEEIIKAWFKHIENNS